MIRLLLLAPIAVAIIAVAGLVWFFIDPSHKPANPESSRQQSGDSLAQKFADARVDWDAMVTLRDKLTEDVRLKLQTLEDQRKGVESLENELSQDVPAHTPGKMLLLSLKEKAAALRQGAMDIAHRGKEVLQFAQETKTEIERMKRDLDLGQPLMDKTLIRRQMEAMHRQMEYATMFQRNMLEKSAEYSRSSLEKAVAMQQQVQQMSEQLAALPDTQSSPFKLSLQEIAVRQEQIVIQLSDQKRRLQDINDRVRESMNRTRERVRDLMERNKMTLEDARRQGKERKELLQERLRDQKRTVAK